MKTYLLDQLHHLTLWYQRHTERLYTLALYFLVFLSSIYPQTDRDQGWHYRYGEYFLTHGKLIRGDYYSWTLPDYPWANHSWVYDALFYLWTNIGGYTGLLILAAVVSVLTFAFVATIFPLSLWKKGVLAVFFILMEEVMIGSGMRSQVISLLLFSILIWTLARSREHLRRLWSLPVLFLVWTNVHGDFTLAIGVVAVYLGSYFLIDAYEERNFSTELFVYFSKILVACVIATFINPFGYQAYFESFRHASNPYLRNIMEWEGTGEGCPGCHPNFVLTYAGIFAIACLYAIWRRNWYALPSAALFVLLFWPMWTTRRMLPVFAVLTLPLIAESLTHIKWELAKQRIAPWLYLIILIVFSQYHLYNRFREARIYRFDEHAYCDLGPNCSVAGTQYLIDHPPYGKGFNFYDWGGYMIGKGVPVKLFIDGRMHVWKTEEGYQPFGDYIEMYYHGRDDLFIKYGFDWVFIPVGSDIAVKLTTTNTLGSWKVAYQDDRVLFALRDTESTVLPSKPL